MLVVESSHKQQSVSALSYPPHNPSQKIKICFFFSSPGESVNDEQSSFIHTSSLSGTDPGSHLHNHFPFILNCWWSSSSRKLGFLFIVPIHARTHTHGGGTVLRFQAHYQTFYSKIQKNKLAFSALLDVQMPHPCFAMIDVRKGSFSSIT